MTYMNKYIVMLSYENMKCAHIPIFAVLLLTRYFFNLHYAVNLQLRLRAKTKANPERGRAKSELGWAKSEQGRAKSEQGRASWKFHIEY